MSDERKFLEEELYGWGKDNADESVDSVFDAEGTTEGAEAVQPAEQTPEVAEQGVEQTEVANQSEELLKLNQIKEKLAKVERFEPILQRMEIDPDFTQRVVQAYYGDAANQKQEAQEPPKLTPPKKPENFDPYEIFDESTPSGQWYKAQREYELEVERMRLREEAAKLAQEQVAPILDYFQQQQAAAVEQKVMNALAQDLKTKYQDADTDDFFQWAADPNNFNLDNLFYAYQYSKQQSQPQQGEQQLPQQAPVGKKQYVDAVKNAPRPVAQQPSQRPQLDDSQEFLKGIVSATKDWGKY